MPARVIWSVLVPALVWAQPVPWRQHRDSAFQAFRQSHYEEAEQLLNTAIQEAGGNAHRLVDLDRDLAEAYTKQSRYADAERAYRRILAIFEKDAGPDHPAVAACLEQLVDNLRRQQKYTEAEPLLQRAVTIIEKYAGSSHAALGYSLSHLAAVFAQEGKNLDALRTYQQAITNLTAALGPENGLLPDLFEDYAGLLGRMAQPIEARRYRDQAAAIRTARCIKGNPGATPPKLLAHDPAGYSEEAQKFGLQGTVVLYFELDTEGMTHNIAILQPLGMGMDERAMEALRQWRFEPARKNGVPFSSANRSQMNFTTM